jgi:hypothetical protein
MIEDENLIAIIAGNIVILVNPTDLQSVVQDHQETVPRGHHLQHDGRAIA